MAMADRRNSNGVKKRFSLCPFWQSGTSSSSSSSSTHNLTHTSQNGNITTTTISSSNPYADARNSSKSGKTVSSVARSLLPARRRLRLDPSNKLYFPYAPGKQARSAIRLKNTSRSHVAFKFQTTAPKSCFMRPPGGILAPGESLIATVFKFVEHPENNEKVMDQKSKVKFKIMSLKVKGGTEYVPELVAHTVVNLLEDNYLKAMFQSQNSCILRVLIEPKTRDMSKNFDEQKDQVTVERILRVVFLDMQHPSSAMEKLKRQLAEAEAALENGKKRQLAEAEAALENRKKPPPDTGPRIVGEGLVIAEWREMKEKMLLDKRLKL